MEVSFQTKYFIEFERFDLRVIAIGLITRERKESRPIDEFNQFLVSLVKYVT